MKLTPDHVQIWKLKPHLSDTYVLPNTMQPETLIAFMECDRPGTIRVVVKRDTRSMEVHLPVRVVNDPMYGKRYLVDAIDRHLK